MLHPVETVAKQFDFSSKQPVTLLGIVTYKRQAKATVSCFTGKGLEIN
jgi:hypothetical protein